MSLALYRIDDRLIHGQVVVGWGQPLNAAFIVLVDDEVRDSEWEQELYRMGVPPTMEVVFASLAEAARRLPEWEADARTGHPARGRHRHDGRARGRRGRTHPAVNIGGIHHRAGPQRAAALRLPDRRRGGEAAPRSPPTASQVTAQDVPTARAVPIGEFL